MAKTAGFGSVPMTKKRERTGNFLPGGMSKRKEPSHSFIDIHQPTAIHPSSIHHTVLYISQLQVARSLEGGITFRPAERDGTSKKCCTVLRNGQIYWGRRVLGRFREALYYDRGRRASIIWRGEARRRYSSPPSRTRVL